MTNGIHRCLLLALKSVVSLLPRNKRKWVFDEGTNSKYFFFELQERDIPQKTFLILHDKKEVERMRKRYPNVLYLRSIKSIFHMLTSGVFIVTQTLGNELFLPLTTGAHIIDLWHGVTLKKLGVIDNFHHHYKTDAVRKTFRALKSRAKKLLNMSYHFLVTSPFIEKHFSDCFMLTESQCIRSSYPRNKFMSRPEPEIRKHLEEIQDMETIRLIDKFKSYQKIIIYAPTLRDAGTDFISTSMDFGRLNETLSQKNYLFLLKLHFATFLDLKSLSKCTNILLLDHKMDIYPILPFTSMLVTDYSSTYHDYMLLNKEILLYPFDKEEYTSRSRELAFDYDKYTPGTKVYTFDQLLEAIKSDLPCKPTDEQRAFVLETFWKWRDNDLYEEIVGKLKKPKKN